MRDNEDYFPIDVIENLVEEVCNLNLAEIKCREEEPQPTIIKALKGLSPEPSFPSTEFLPQLKLKPLPNFLKYVFLGPNKTLLVIITTDLAQDQEAQLIEVLKDHQAAIRWSITDMKGISPSLCMHHIFTDEDAKPFRDM